VLTSDDEAFYLSMFLRGAMRKLATLLTLFAAGSAIAAETPGYHEPATDASQWTASQLEAWRKAYLGCFVKFRPRDPNASGALNPKQEKECQAKGLAAATSN
jgi:hypothetical protein